MSRLQNWLQPVLGESAEEGAHTISPTVVTLLTLLVVGGGAVAAFLQFGRRPIAKQAPLTVGPVVAAARNNLYADA